MLCLFSQLFLFQHFFLIILFFFFFDDLLFCLNILNNILLFRNFVFICVGLLRNFNLLWFLFLHNLVSILLFDSFITVLSLTWLHLLIVPFYAIIVCSLISSLLFKNKLVIILLLFLFSSYFLFYFLTFFFLILFFHMNPIFCNDLFRRRSFLKLRYWRLNLWTILRLQTVFQTILFY